MSASRLRDLLVYLVIALVIGLGIVWYAYSGPPRDSNVIARWGGLIVNTAILFGYMINDSRRSWHAPTFWVLAVSMLIVHLAAFSFILVRAEEWKVIWFLVMYPIEIPVFLLLRDRIVNVHRASRRTR